MEILAGLLLSAQHTVSWAMNLHAPKLHLGAGGRQEEDPYLVLSWVIPVSSGKAEGNGKMHITLCDFIVPWDTLSSTQKKSLNHRYQMGCECKVSWYHLPLGFTSSPPSPGGLPGFPGPLRPRGPQDRALGRDGLSTARSPEEACPCRWIFGRSGASGLVASSSWEGDLPGGGIFWRGQGAVSTLYRCTSAKT